MAEASISQLRTCTKCGSEKPASLQFFSRCAKVRSGLSSQCKVCQKAYRDSRVVADPEMHKRIWERRKDAHNASRRAARTEKLQGTNAAEYRAKERAIRAEYRKANYQRLKEKADAARRQRQAEINRRHREKRRTSDKFRAYYDAYGKEWRKRNRDKARSYVRNRRARLKSADGQHTADDIARQLAEQNGHCFYCSSELTVYHVDHFIPISRGGSNAAGNIVIACPPCNQAKADKLPWEWRPDDFEEARLNVEQRPNLATRSKG